MHPFGWPFRLYSGIDGKEASNGGEEVLVWLVAGAAVLLGIAMLLMAHFMYRFGATVRGAGG